MVKYHEVDYGGAKRQLICKLLGKGLHPGIPPYKGKKRIADIAFYLGYRGSEWQQAPAHIKKVVKEALVDAGFIKDSSGLWLYPTQEK